MGKNKKRKKNGNGIIIEIHRNYGIISTDSFGQDNEQIPFEITTDMIKNHNETEFIEYSENVTFELNKGVSLRNRLIKEATHLVFNNNLISKERKKSLPYLQEVRNKFKEFNVCIPDDSTIKKSLTDKTGFNKFFSPQDITNIDEFNKLNLKSSDDLLYEYLKIEGFQPYMLEYLTDGLLVSDKFPHFQKEQLKSFSVSDIVSIDKIDKVFREKILKWVLGIESSYKSLLSRIATHEQGGDLIAKKVVEHWANSNDSSKQEQYKRAKNRYKYMKYSDRTDYVNNNVVPFDDLLDQLDISSLEAILSVFDEKSREDIIIDNTSSVKAVYPWVRDIVLNKEVLRDLRVIRNAAAHGRPILPTIVDPDVNPNWDMEFDNPLGRTKIEEWKLYDAFLRSRLSLGNSKESKTQYMQPIYGNPVRKAWFELNFIYYRFISMFDSKIFIDFISETEDFLNYETPSESGGLSRKINPKLYDLGDLTNFEYTGIPPVYRTIANEAFVASDVAKIHNTMSLTKNNIKNYL